MERIDTTEATATYVFNREIEAKGYDKRIDDLEIKVAKLTGEYRKEYSAVKCTSVGTAEGTHIKYIAREYYGGKWHDWENCNELEATMFAFQKPNKVSIELAKGGSL